MNIVDPILFQCRRQPPVAAICAPGPGIGLISYRRLEQLIHNISRRLHAYGLPERSIVAINIGDAIFHIAILLASTRLGLITISLREGDVSLPFKIDALLTDKPRVIANAGRMILADLSWTEGDGKPLEPRLLPQTHDEDLCRLYLTSGTTSEPKAVPVWHKLLSDRVGRHLQVFGNRLVNCSRIYNDIPISSALGFQFLIYTLWRGGTAFFPGDNFANTLRVIEEHQVECLVGTPGGYENLLRWFDTIPSYQSNIKVILSGGDTLSRSLSDRLRSRICSHVMVSYGSSEANILATAHAHEIADVPRAVGFVQPGVTVQILDQAGTLLPPGQEGQVRVRSEVGVNSYFNNPDESKKVFRDGWFYPGDIGSVSADGLLVITGREQAVLNIGGSKISPESIELALVQFQGVVEAAVIATPNAYGVSEITAMLVVRDHVDEQALRTYCDAHIPRPFAPVKYLFVASLPHNEMGKLDRRRLQHLAQELAAPPG